MSYSLNSHITDLLVGVGMARKDAKKYSQRMRELNYRQGKDIRWITEGELTSTDIRLPHNVAEKLVDALQKLPEGAASDGYSTSSVESDVEEGGRRNKGKGKKRLAEDDIDVTMGAAGLPSAPYEAPQADYESSSARPAPSLFNRFAAASTESGDIDEDRDVVTESVAKANSMIYWILNLLCVVSLVFPIATIANTNTFLDKVNDHSDCSDDKDFLTGVNDTTIAFLVLSILVLLFSPNYWRYVKNNGTITKSGQEEYTVWLCVIYVFQLVSVPVFLCLNTFNTRFRNELVCRDVNAVTCVADSDLRNEVDCSDFEYDSTNLGSITFYIILTVVLSAVMGAITRYQPLIFPRKERRSMLAFVVVVVSNFCTVTWLWSAILYFSLGELSSVSAAMKDSFLGFFVFDSVVCVMTIILMLTTLCC
eukprot:GFYU01000287.1.p1 GENE.GFYU01000287.1~~GFYU01000287.1.p1  ORF type:complete len:422 (-),score=121.24 GFYU01000287.1:136-1401(-)